MGVRFDAESRVVVLEELFRATGARRLTIRLEGPAAEIADQVILDLVDGRLLEVVAGPRRGLEALTVLALSDAGTIETSPIPEVTDRDAARFPDAVGLVRQAEASAVELSRLLAHVGGLGAVPVPDFDRLVDQLQQIPDAANAVLRLVDARCTAASILGRAPHSLRLTTRILHRLVLSEIVVPPGTVSPPIIEGPESYLGSPDEREGEDVEADVGRWLSRESPPESLLTEGAFTTAFAEHASDAKETSSPAEHEGVGSPPEAAARVRQAVPLTTKRPGPAWGPEEPPGKPAARPSAEAAPDDDVLRAAGVGGTSAQIWIGIAVFGVFLGVVASFIFSGGDGQETQDAGMAVLVVPDAGSSTVSSTVAVATSTVGTATSAVELGPDGRPPIAGPDAPEDVRRAEAHLDAGRYSSARELLDQLRKTRPDDPTVFILSGQLEVDLGRLRAAEAMADRALELDPKSYRGWVLKGSVLQFRGRFKAAKDAYRRAIKLGPDHPMTPEIESVIDQMIRSVSDQ